MIKKLKTFNQYFIQNNLCGDIESEDIFKFFDKKTNVILSAPHSTRTFANQKEKACDLFTGAIVQALPFSHIIRCKYTNKKEDITDFVISKSLQKHWFLDIHGMKEDVPFELAVGTGMLPANIYEKEINLIKELAKKYKISLVLNHPSYHASHGFTRQLQERCNSTKILQLELRKDLRDFYNSPKKVQNQTMPFLKELAKATS